MLNIVRKNIAYIIRVIENHILNTAEMCGTSPHASWTLHIFQENINN